MTTFEMIKYHGKEYPRNIPLRLEEIAAHFDVWRIEGALGWSLHTEYSYGKRRFDSDIIAAFPEIVTAQKEGIPLLWKNELWSLQFADFIVRLCGKSSRPKVIEIHPPFNDYTNMREFVQNYSIFEERIKENFPEVEILIENRCGSVYHSGKFVVSKVQDVMVLCDHIERTGLSLKIAYDLPQIYTAHNADTEKKYLRLLEKTNEFRKFIGGVHLWGKRISNTGKKISHCGDLTTYFGNDAVKYNFLHGFYDCFNDGIIRKMVLEVNSGNQDLISIINDLQSAGIKFI